MRALIITVAVVAILGIGAFLLVNNKNKKTESTSSTSSTSQSNSSDNSNGSSNTDNSSSTTPATSATITYSDSGFSPATVTVTSGGTVTIKNSSGSGLQFNSDPHPSHTANPELNVGTVDDGSSKTITVTKTGTWGYHNHLFPNDRGTIVVK